MHPSPLTLIPILACGIIAAADQRPPSPPDPAAFAALVMTNGDQNGDGVLTLAELKTGLEASRPPRRPEAGTRGDGTKDDARKPRRGPDDDGQAPPPPPPPPPGGDRLATLFTAADQDKSGTLNDTELASLLQELGKGRGHGHRPPPPEGAGPATGTGTTTKPADGF